MRAACCSLRLAALFPAPRVPLIPSPARAGRPRAGPVPPATTPGPAAGRACRSHVRPSACPSRHARIGLVVAGEQHVRHPRALIRLGPRVVRAIEQPGRKRVLRRRLGVVQHAGTQPQHRVDQHQRRQLASRDDEVADGQLLVDFTLDQPLVDPFVTPREQHQTRRVAFRRQFGHPPVRQRRARRRQVECTRRLALAFHSLRRPRRRQRLPPAAPPASPFPARRHTGGRRRSGADPSRNRADSTRRGARVRAPARAPSPRTAPHARSSPGTA